MKLKQHKETPLSGFTLIELAVVLGILVIFTGVGIVNFNQGQKITAVNRAADEVVNVIRKAQNFALVGEPNLNNRVPCGFGVHFDDTDPDEATLIIFSEDPDPVLDGSCGEIYNPPVSPFNRQYDAFAGEEFGSPIELTEKHLVKIASASNDIFFAPPDGITWIGGERETLIPPNDKIEIVVCLRSACSSVQAVVRATLGGAVEVIKK